LGDVRREDEAAAEVLTYPEQVVDRLSVDLHFAEGSGSEGRRPRSLRIFAMTSETPAATLASVDPTAGIRKRLSENVLSDADSFDEVQLPPLSPVVFVELAQLPPLSPVVFVELAQLPPLSPVVFAELAQ